MDIQSRRKNNIYAIVLTYDANHIFVDNLLYKMQELWPDSGMIYRIPYNKERPVFLENKYKKLKLEFIQTPTHIKQTVLSLIADLDGNDWIYWCIDDKFPIDINKRRAQQTLDWIKNQEDESICGVSFAKVRVLKKLKKSSNSDDQSILTINNELKLLKRESYANVFWMPQFFRTKIISKLFNTFPDYDFQAKFMDAYLKKVKMDPSLKFYVTEKNYTVLCESATRGIATQSLKRSLAECGISNYANKTFNHKDFIIGHMYTFKYYKTKTRSLVGRFKRIIRNGFKR